MSENTPSTPEGGQEPPPEPSLPHAHPDSHHSFAEQDRAAMPLPPPPSTTTPATGAAFGRGPPPSDATGPLPAPVPLAHLDLHSRDVFLQAYASKVGILKEQTKYYEAALDSTGDPGEQHAVLQELLGLNEEAQTLFGNLKESLNGCGGGDDVKKGNAHGEEWIRYMKEFTEADLVRTQQLVPYLRARMSLVIQQMDVMKQLSERQAELFALGPDPNLSAEQSANMLGSYSQAPTQQHSNGLPWQHPGFAPQSTTVDNISRGSTYQATLQQQRGPPPSFGNAAFDDPSAFSQQFSAIAVSSPERFPAFYDQRRQSFNGNSDHDRQRLQQNFKNDHPLHGQRSNATGERGYGRGRSYEPPSHRRNKSYDRSMWQSPQHSARTQMSPGHTFNLGNLSRQHDRRWSQDSASSQGDRHSAHESWGTYQEGYREYERGHFASTSSGRGRSPGNPRGRQHSRSPSKQRDRSQTITPGAQAALGSARDLAAAQHSHPFLPARPVDSASSLSSSTQHRGSMQSSTKSIASIVTSDNLTRASSKEHDSHGGQTCLSFDASAKDENSARPRVDTEATTSKVDRVSKSTADLQQCSKPDGDGNIVKTLPSASEYSARGKPMSKTAGEDIPAGNKPIATRKIDQATEPTQQPSVNLAKQLSDADTWQVARGAKKKPQGRPKPTEKTEPQREKTRSKEPRLEHDENGERDCEPLDKTGKGSKQSRATDKRDARDCPRSEPAKRPEGSKKGKGKSTDSSSAPKQEKSKETSKSVDTSYRHDMSEASFPSLSAAVFGQGMPKHNLEAEATKATWSQMLKAQETRREAEKILREATETILPDSPNWSLVSAPAAPKNNVGTPSSALPGAFSYARAASGCWDTEHTLTPSQQAATPKSKPSDKLRATAPPFTPPAYYATLSSSCGNVGFPLLPSIAAKSLPERSTYAQVETGSKEGSVAVALTSPQIVKKYVVGLAVDMAIATVVHGAPTATSRSLSATLLYSELAARYSGSPRTASGSKVREAVATKTLSASAPTSIAGSVPIPGYAPSLSLPVSPTVISYAQMAVTPITPKFMSPPAEQTTQFATPSAMPSNVSTPKSAKSNDSSATVRPRKSVSSLNAHARVFSYASAAATPPPPPPPTPVAVPSESKTQEAEDAPETPRPKSKSKKGKWKQRPDQSLTMDTSGTTKNSQHRQERASASEEVCYHPVESRSSFGSSSASSAGLTWAQRSASVFSKILTPPQKKQTKSKLCMPPPSPNATPSMSVAAPNPGVSGPSTSASSEGSSMLASASAHSSYHKTDQTETDVGSLPFSSPVRRKDRYKHVPRWMPLDIGGDTRFKALLLSLGGSWRGISDGNSPHLGRAGLTSAVDEDEVHHGTMGSEESNQQYRQSQKERVNELAEAKALEIFRQEREPKYGRERSSPQPAPAANATNEGYRDEQGSDGVNIMQEFKGFQSRQCSQTGAKGAEVTRVSADMGKELDSAKGYSDTREFRGTKINNRSDRFDNADIGGDGRSAAGRRGQSEGFPQKEPSTCARQRFAERPKGQEPPKLENSDQYFSRGSLQDISSGGHDEQCGLPGTHDRNLQHKRRYNPQPADSSVDQATKQGGGSGEDGQVGVAIESGTHVGAKSQGGRDVIDEAEAREGEKPTEGSRAAGQFTSSFNGGSSNHESGGEEKGDKWKQTEEEVSQVEKQQGQDQKLQGGDQGSGKSADLRVVSLAGYTITLSGEDVSTEARGSHVAVEDESAEAHGNEEPPMISWSDELEDEWAGFEELRKDG